MAAQRVAVLGLWRAAPRVVLMVAALWVALLVVMMVAEMQAVGQRAVALMVVVSMVEEMQAVW